MLRPDVAYEAIRLDRKLAALQPDEPEVHGPPALCALTAARFPARTGQRAEARAELELAARLCANQQERSVLLRKAAMLG